MSRLVSLGVLLLCRTSFPTLADDMRPEPVQPSGQLHVRTPRHAGPMIVYTAHQDWLSRIYLLGMDGSVINYFEYDFHYLADVEVVDNEVYIAEAFAPRVLRVRSGDGRPVRRRR